MRIDKDLGILLACLCNLKILTDGYDKNFKTSYTYKDLIGDHEYTTCKH